MQIAKLKNIFKVQHAIKVPSVVHELQVDIGALKIYRFVNKRAYACILAPWYEDTTFAPGDGYIQRIRDIDDNIFKNRVRLYIYNSPYWTTNKLGFYSNLEEDYCYIIYNDSIGRHVTIVTKLLEKANICYIHSIYRLMPSIPSENAYWTISRFNRFMRHSIVDLHGIGSEEMKMYMRPQTEIDNAESIERYVAENAKYCIGVTNRMREVMEEKYAVQLQNYLVMPIGLLAEETQSQVRKHENQDSIAIVYSGGLQKCQRIEDMLDAVEKSTVNANYWFCINDTDEFEQLLSQKCFSKKIQYGHKTSKELKYILSQSDYGFLIRDDNPVNQVACPTKLIEYLYYGIVPILETVNIGDFANMGLKYVSLQDYVSGIMPESTVQTEMANSNFRIFQQLVKQRQVALREIKRIVALSYERKVGEMNNDI